MNSKKALPIFVIISFMLALIPAAMFANATTGSQTFSFTNNYLVSNGYETTTVHNEGVKGDIVSSQGSGVPAGTIVQLYWDDVTHAWNGVNGLVNSTTAASDGTFDIWFTIPEAVTGLHSIWFKDYLGNSYGPFPFTIDTDISLNHSSGLPGDTITATMYGFADDAAMKIDFGTVPATPGYTLDIASVTANSVGTSIVSFKVPSTAVLAIPPAAPTQFTIVAYNGTVAIPYEYEATATYTVGPTITVNPTAAVVGQVVYITGRGFASGATIGLTASNVQLQEGSSYPGTLISDVAIKSMPTGGILVDGSGHFSMNIFVPNGPNAPISSDYYLVVVDSKGDTAYADFQITKLAAVTVTPDYGSQGSTMTISGYGFDHISGNTVTIDLHDATTGLPLSPDVQVGTVDTAADGTFSANFKVPAVTNGNYQLYASTPEDISNYTSFRIGVIYAQLSDTSGAAGDYLTLTGNGFTPSGDFNATIGTVTLLGSTPIDSSGLINVPVSIPQMAAGTYTVTIWDITADIQVTFPFTVTSNTMITLSPSTAPNLFNVSIYGSGFWEGAPSTSIDFELYNKTSTGAFAQTWTMNVLTNYLSESLNADPTAVVNASGVVRAFWMVPDSDTLSPGTYYVNATDSSSNAYFAQATFVVHSELAVCTPRKTSFMIGETVSFVMQHSYGGVVGSVADGSYLRIYDGNGTLQFAGDPIKASSWVTTGDFYTAPYSAQTAGGNPMVLQDDAPTGTWTYNWYDSSSSHALIASGTFTVAASATSATNAQITALAAQVTAVANSVSTLSTTVGNVATAANAASTAASAASTAASAAQTGAAAATTAATTAGTKADAATAAATAAETAANNAASSANNLTTLVYGAIGASLVAALAAIVALMQISRKIA